MDYSTSFRTMTTTMQSASRKGADADDEIRAMYSCDAAHASSSISSSSWLFC
jgi:hypothetical protein